MSFLLLLSATAQGKMLTREEALQSAFPGARIESSVIFLTDQQKKEASEICGQEIDSALIAQYTAWQDGKEIGRAYLDTHIVRTKKESLLVILGTDGKVKRIEVVAFLEPPDYLPSDRWYAQFEGKTLSQDLRLNRSIYPITGATLTARATTGAVRRVLAIDQVLQRKEEKP